MISESACLYCDDFMTQVQAYFHQFPNHILWCHLYVQTVFRYFLCFKFSQITKQIRWHCVHFDTLHFSSKLIQQLVSFHRSFYTYRYLQHSKRNPWLAIFLSSYLPFSRSFPSMKLIIFWFEFQLNLSPRVQWTIYISIGADNGLVLNRWQTVIWTNDGLI